MVGFLECAAYAVMPVLLGWLWGLCAGFNGFLATILTFVVIGGIIYYIVIGIVLWLKMPSEDLKLFTAIIVAIFLAVPYLKGQSKSSFKKAGKKAAAMAAGSKEGK